MKIKFTAFLLCIILSGAACKHKSATGWQYARENSFPIYMQETAPGLILVEGKAATQSPINKTIPHFYISRYEETNGQYLAYLNFLRKYYSLDTYEKALPDTNVWMKENLPDEMRIFLMNRYLRSDDFKYYPVVGLTPEQIEQYCRWKTDRLNEMILIREGILASNNSAKDSTDIFLMDVYFHGKDSLLKHPRVRNTRMEDGIFMPSYRLPTAEEWQLASLAIGDNHHTYIKTPQEISNKKFDQENYFHFLYNQARPIRESMFFVPNLHTTRNTTPNNYLIYGLRENVSELVKNGHKYSVMGGSWKNISPDFSAVYDKASCDSVKYIFRTDFTALYTDEPFISATTGFRVAMSLAAGDGKLPVNRKNAISKPSGVINIFKYVNENAPLKLIITKNDSTTYLTIPKYEELFTGSAKYTRLFQWIHENLTGWKKTPVSFNGNIALTQGDFRLIHTMNTNGVMIGFKDKDGNPRQYIKEIKRGELDFLLE